MHGSIHTSRTPAQAPSAMPPWLHLGGYAVFALLCAKAFAFVIGGLFGGFAGAVTGAAIWGVVDVLWRLTSRPVLRALILGGAALMALGLMVAAAGVAALLRSPPPDEPPATAAKPWERYQPQGQSPSASSGGSTANAPSAHDATQWNEAALRWEARNADFLADPARAAAMQRAIDAIDGHRGILPADELLQRAAARAFDETGWSPAPSIEPSTPSAIRDPSKEASRPPVPPAEPLRIVSVETGSLTTSSAPQFLPVGMVRGTDPFATSIRSAGEGIGTVEATWTFQDGQVVATRALSISHGDAAVLTVAPPHRGWRAGRYSVLVTLNGRPADQRDFTVP